MPMKEIQQKSRRQFVNQTRTRAIAVDTGTGSQRTQILSELGKFAQAATGEASRQLNAEIETKKVLGASRAAQDLLKAESARQGTDEDDALATKLAYNNIVGKHDTMNAGNEFAEWYKVNPDASDEDIEAKKTELYQPLMAKYGGDENTLKQVSLQVQESQFHLLGVQEQIKQQHTKAKHKEALGISVNDLLASTNADMDEIVDKELPARAKALGLTEWDLKSTMVNQAAQNAAEGDERLLAKLEGEKWAKDSAAIKKARSDYDKFIAREQSPAIGNAMADIELENVSLSVPWETTLNKIEELNKRFPNTYSKERTASVKKARARAEAKDVVITNGTKSTFAIFKDGSRLPLAQDPAYTPSERSDIVKSLEGEWSTKYKEMVEQGADESEVRASIFKEQLKWSRLNQTKLPVLADALQATMSLSIDDIVDGKELPRYVKDNFDMLKEMDSTALDLYLPSKKDTAFALNFKKFSGNMSDEEAFRRADLLKRNPYKVAPLQRQEQRGKTTTIVNEALKVGVWEGLNPFSKRKEVPEWQRVNIINRLNDSAEQFLYAGGNDAEYNAKHVLTNFQASSTQAFNGTILNKPLNVIHSKISEGRDLPLKRTNEYIEAFIRGSKPLLDKAYMQDVDVNNVTLEFNEDATEFRFVDSNGEYLAGRFSTNSIYDVGKEAVVNSLNKSEESQTSLGEDIAANKEAIAESERREEIGNTPVPSSYFN